MREDRTSFGQGGNVYSLGGVHNEEWINPKSRNLAAPKFRVSAVRIQMPRVSAATVEALPTTSVRRRISRLGLSLGLWTRSSARSPGGTR